MPMTYLSEIGARNQHRFLSRLTWVFGADFWYCTCVMGLQLVWCQLWILLVLHQDGKLYLVCDIWIPHSVSILPTKLASRILMLPFLPIFLYGLDCWAMSKTDARKIDALDQWCLRMLLGIKWYQFVRNDDVRRLTKQVSNPNSLL